MNLAGKILFFCGFVLFVVGFVCGIVNFLDNLAWWGDTESSSVSMIALQILNYNLAQDHTSLTVGKPTGMKLAGSIQKNQSPIIQGILGHHSAKNFYMPQYTN